jgi:hypothetical protein
MSGGRDEVRRVTGANAKKTLAGDWSRERDLIMVMGRGAISPKTIGMRWWTDNHRTVGLVGLKGTAVWP